MFRAWVRSRAVSISSSFQKVDGPFSVNVNGADKAVPRWIVGREHICSEALAGRLCMWPKAAAVVQRPLQRWIGPSVVVLTGSLSSWYGDVTKQAQKAFVNDSEFTASCNGFSPISDAKRTRYIKASGATILFFVSMGLYIH